MNETLELTVLPGIDPDKPLAEQTTLSSEILNVMDRINSNYIKRMSVESTTSRAFGAPDRVKLEAYVSALYDVPVPTLTHDSDNDALERVYTLFVMGIRDIIISMTENTDDAKLL